MPAFRLEVNGTQEEDSSAPALKFISRVLEDVFVYGYRITSAEFNFWDSDGVKHDTEWTSNDPGDM